MAYKEDKGEMKKFHAPPPVADINVTPMVDVMLVMLIIFMVITPMLSKDVSVDLVKTHNQVAMPAADKEDAVVVAITREGRTYLGSKATKAEDLPPKVKACASSGKPRSLLSVPSTPVSWSWAGV